MPTLPHRPDVLSTAVLPPTSHSPHLATHPPPPTPRTPHPRKPAVDHLFRGLWITSSTSP
ncbi:MAG: hypothetical protein C0475_06680 [Planctomyces sp.]|nr:hypothetical protein [Planctomyces sp.]MBA4120712.1 hypothetical protein [Isosphaera sp.]